MTVTIELPDDLAARLEAAGIPAEQAGRFAVATLARIAERAEADAEEIDAWWASLTEEQQAEERAKTEAGIAAVDAGRVSPAEEVYARVRAGRVSSKVA